MEGYIRIGLLLVAGVILFLMFRESRLRSRRYRDIPVMNCEDFSEMDFEDEVESEHSAKNESKKKTSYESDYLIISIVAKNGKKFESYDLLQSISATGMQYGHGRLFHYYVPYENKAVSLFSLSSLTKPGDFDLDRIGDFSCAGLSLFMDLRDVPDPECAFELMFKTAEQLTEDLEGELRAGQQHPWNETMLKLYREKAIEYSPGIEV